MSDKTGIPLQVWWDTATASGKIRYGTLENLAKQTGLSQEQLLTIFKQEVATLGEWWNSIGAHLYREGHGKGTGKGALARELTALLPEHLRPFPRTSLSEYIRGVSFPQYRDYYAALFAITALPCFQPEGVPIPTLGERQSRPKAPAIATQKQLRFAESLAEVLLQQLQGLAESRPSKAQIAKLISLLQEIRIIGEGLAEAEENARLVHTLGVKLGATLGPPRQK